MKKKSTLYDTYRKVLENGGGIGDAVDSDTKDRFGNPIPATVTAGSSGSTDSGDPDDKMKKLQNLAPMVAGTASGIIDATATADPITGRKSIGSTVAKDGLGGAAAGFKVAGPLGAAIGGGLGLVKGLIDGGKERREARKAMRLNYDNIAASDMALSNARVASDPSLVYGNRGASYYAEGGNLTDTYMKDAAGPGKKAYNPNLSANDAGFQNWYKANTPEGKSGSAFDIKKGDYDYYSFYRNGDYKTYSGGHFPDTYKMPGHKTFSNESIYSTPENPGGYWTGEQYHKNGKFQFAEGGDTRAPLSKMYMTGGNAASMSSDTTEIKGRSHAAGGVQVPGLNAEVEGGETTDGSYVFSKKLGFADLHKPIAKAKGIIESKPATAERINSLRRLNGREGELRNAQELTKAYLNH